MVFSDIIFISLFLPVTLIGYYLVFGKCSISVRNNWLLFASLIFYAWGEPLYVLLMIVSITVNWLLGRWVEPHAKTKKGSGILALACVFNLGMLFVFKYLSWILGLFGLEAASAATKLALPIGISFYTFQALSYVIDVYRGKDEAQKSVINVGLYISFFPQLIAGPIVRYNLIASQLKERVHSKEGFAKGAWRFTVGLSKKILLANQLAKLAELSFGMNPSERSVALAWAGALAFMLQIYFDFSGYSDMAIGLGSMFGFDIPENFNYPYIAKSVSEYWRRWHMTLGGWFRDYLYYPLSFKLAPKMSRSLSKHMKRKTAAFISSAVVLFIVWMSTGMWHGANATFVLWGFIQFVFIFWEQNRKGMKNKKLEAVIGFITTYLIGLVTKVIFNSNSVADAFGYYGSMLGLSGNAGIDATSIYWLGQFKVVLLVSFIFSFPVIPKLREFFNKKNLGQVFEYVLAAVLLVLLVVDISYAIGGDYNPFIYFNF